MKVVINTTYGGYGLSPLAIKELAKKKGKACYLFTFHFPTKEYIPASIEQAEKAFMFSAYSVPNPQDYRLNERNADGLFGEANKRAKEISLQDIGNDRSDPDLIEVVERLGDKANGRHAALKIVEIPDGVDYQIEEYDGLEHIAEKHRTWS